MVVPRSSSDRAAPMAAAPFVWRADGRPDWGAMWTSFCDLALHGGPPHRGPEQALSAPRTADAESDSAMVLEIRRGIWETTGLFSEPASPGWIAVTCESSALAEWLTSAIALENVEARVEDDRVLLPAGPRFRLENEVKSIITVVAKTHHYGATHAGIAARPARPDAGSRRYGFRCAVCGRDFRVSRPATVAGLDATCPVDGTAMDPRDLATMPPSPSFGHGRPLKVAIGGPGDGKRVLIEALRRRYGRRRAVVVSAAQAPEMNDPAIDVVLVEIGDTAIGPETVDATIGVLDASALADAGGLDAWRLLVVTTGGVIDQAPLRERTARRRGPVVFVDLATAGGVDVVTSWLQRELLLSPWRERRVTS